MLGKLFKFQKKEADNAKLVDSAQLAAYQEDSPDTSYSRCCDSAQQPARGAVQKKRLLHLRRQHVTVQMVES